MRNLHPIERDILRALYGLKLGATAYKVAKRIGIHPYTAKERLSSLIKAGYVLYDGRGNRRYYRLSQKGEWRLNNLY